jgi:hypothetical protein
MKIHANTCKLGLLLGLIAILATGCLKPGEGGPTPEQTPETGDTRGFDPLGLPRDREVVPQIYPRSGNIQGSEQVVVDSSQNIHTRLASTPVEIEQTDTTYGQAFRVQLATSKVYGEARREVRVAEEIFDRPVYLDYEVPYYKVRVGSFRSRDDAEEYQQRARSAGYENAWVVLVNVQIKQPPPLYPDFPVPQYIDTTETSDSTDVD